MVTTKQMNE